MKKLCAALAAVFIGFITALPASAEGNRYDLERRYHSEISAAKAFLLTNHDRGHKQRKHKKRHGDDDDGDDNDNAVIIDVRTVEEYGAGHPKGSYNIPFPHIHSRPWDVANYIGQDPVQFVSDVIAAIPDRSTPILTLCRTGYRSVLAANLLADAGYTNVRNIWQGFVGNHKVDTAGNTLDVNNDSVIDDSDRDGWANFQELPYSTKLRPYLIYAPYAYLY